MNSQLYKRVKWIVYLSTFVISIWMKWNSYDPQGTFPFIVINQILFIPVLLMLGLMYFQYRYHHNVFIQTRFQSLHDVRKHHFKTNILEAIEFSLWQLVIAAILGFHDFSFESCYALFITIITIILYYIAYAVIYTSILEIFNHYYYAFGICAILMVAYRIIVYGQLRLGSYTLSLEGIVQNYLLIVAYLFVIVGSLSFTKLYFQQKILIRINRKTFMIIACVFIELFSEILLRNQSLSYTSFSLINYFGFMQNNELFIILIWLLPKIVLLYVGFMIFVERYRLNYTFYAVRINNKRRWVDRVMKELCLFLIILVVNKLVFHCLYYQVFNISLLWATIEYFLYSLSWLSLLIVAYIIGKSESVFNYFMIVYIITNAFIGILQISSLQFLLLDSTLMASIIFLIFIICAYNITVYLMNHHEYY